MKIEQRKVTPLSDFKFFPSRRNYTIVVEDTVDEKEKKAKIPIEQLRPYPRDTKPPEKKQRTSKRT